MMLKDPQEENRIAISRKNYTDTLIVLERRHVCVRER